MTTPHAYAIGDPVMREIGDGFLTVFDVFQQDGAEWLELGNRSCPERSFKARADTCLPIQLPPVPPKMRRRG